MKTKIKICGINNEDFARRAEALGADYLGFIFVPDTPRCVTVAKVRAITAQLKGTARRVGVFMHETVAEIDRVARLCGLGIVQLHRRADAADVAALQAKGYEVWTLAGGAEGDGVLFDSSHGDGALGDRALPIGAEAGGRAGLKPPPPALVIVAGGISAANLGGKLKLGADVIDVSGSLETAPGVKSIAKLNEFFETFRKETGHAQGIK